MGGYYKAVIEILGQHNYRFLRSGKGAHEMWTNGKRNQTVSHEADLRRRTLTNLYNLSPEWLTLAHEALDRAVAAAYGWTDYTPAMPDVEILMRLLSLNGKRAAAEAAGPN